jgi:hypothetical protein
LEVRYPGAGIQQHRFDGAARVDVHSIAHHQLGDLVDQRLIGQGGNRHCTAFPPEQLARSRHVAILERLEPCANEEAIPRQGEHAGILAVEFTTELPVPVQVLHDFNPSTQSAGPSNSIDISSERGGTGLTSHIESLSL